MHFGFIIITKKSSKDNKVVLLINTIKLLQVLFIFSHKSCISELANKVLVHFAACINLFTYFQLEVLEFFFEI